MSEDAGALTVPGYLENIAGIRSWLDDILRQWSLPDDVVSDIQTAITEICTNVIRHGYQTENEDHGEIRLTVLRTPETIEISITDDAPVFIPDSGSDLPLHTGAEGGYGRFLANTLMDQIRYEPLGEIGNRTTLIKRIAGESQGVD